MASASSNDYNEKTKSTNNNIRSGFLGKTGTDEAPLDRTYYNILNVSPNANASEIKRAYYALSLQYHPDRTQNLDDFTRREYAERFKLISQAYSILSDPEKRTLYNRYGKDERLVSQGNDGISLEDFDAEEFFRYMFGGEEFIDIIGDFELAKSFKYAISEIFNENEQTTDQQNRRLAYTEERAKAHEERIKKLSTNLILKLSIYTDIFLSESNDIQSTQALNVFIEKIRSDIPNLLQAPHGEQLLHSIGYIYSTKARFWLSKMDSQEGHLGKRILGYGKNVQTLWRDRAHVIKETVKTVKCAVQWHQSMSKLANVTDEESNDSQYPFQHHSGHLEYSGFTPSEPTISTSSINSNANMTPPMKHKQKTKSSTRSIVPLTDEEKRQLETDTATKSMEALWRATKLEIESIQRDVCDQILNELSCPREIRRRRCKALSKMGELWQQASLLNAA
ncbi:unnamed protein product [Rotaria sp. Silwood2]|nr:unnamed protein product [Rotaria sp. Silwood2]CAF2525089.1 unnamed protein product [Rotaria sp. Silwood2]CAF2773047.1 unnamed protein product [Rotaria sp. Silwood2]CAF3934821.1 unnamed protein product [Rotaria sp. Silwood2]CAF3980985.1 unnamed protein product [Rotaria sp. Silwood2]